MEGCSRRSFLAGSAIAATATSLHPLFGRSQASSSPFRISVINDEISPDFDHVCSVVSKDFGLNWIELRSMWGKNIMDLSDDQIAESKQILAKYNLQVTDIASPLFKTDWPGAPPFVLRLKGRHARRGRGRVQAPGRAARATPYALAETIQHRQSALLRLLAS